MPDDALLASAASGELNTPEGVEKAARRMLADPKAKEGSTSLSRSGCGSTACSAPRASAGSIRCSASGWRESMTEEARRFIGDIVWNDRDFMEVFSGNYSFINSDLAAVYEMEPPARDFDRVEFPPASERAGILGQALFLTSTSKPDDTAPTGRGLFVREQFLCQAGAASAAGRGYESSAGR